MIAPPHAILVMTNVFQRMSLLHKHIRDIMRDFQDERLTSSNSVFTKLQFGGFVHRHNQTLTQEFVRNTVALHTVGTPAPGHIWTPEHGFLTCPQFDQQRSTKVTRHFELHPVESPTPDVSCMMTRSVFQTVQQSEDPRHTEPQNAPDQDANQEDLSEDLWSVSGLALHSSAVCPLSPMSGAESVVHTVNSSDDDGMHPTIDVSHHQPVEAMTGTVSPCHAANLGTGSLPAQVGDVTQRNDHLPDEAMGTGSLPAHLPANTEDLCTARSTMLSNPITAATRNPMGTGSLPAHEGIQDFSLNMGTGTLPAHEPYLARSSQSKNAERFEWYRSRLEHDTTVSTPAGNTTDGTNHEALQTTAESCNGQSVLTSEANPPPAATHASQLETEKPISPISTATKSSDEGGIADTVPFQPVFKGTVTWLGYHEEFWFAADMPSDAIEAVWGLCNCTTMQQPHELIKLRLTPAHPQAWHQESTQRPDNMCLLILMDGELTLMKVEPRKGLLQQDHICQITETFYDQFGQVHGGQTADYGLLFLPQPLTHEALTHELIYVFAAFAQVTTHWHRNKQTNTIIASFQGPEPAAALLRQLFAMALSPQSLDLLGRQIYYAEATGEIRFVPARNKGVAPPQPFLIALVVAVVRSQLDACKEDASDQPPVLLKWAGRPIWKGILHPKTTLGTMAAILKQSLVPLNAGKQYRLVVNGRQVPHDMLIENLPPPTREYVVIHAVMEMHGGGQGTKSQQRDIQQNALASLLLDHGLPLAWTTTAVEKIMQKTGLPRLQALNSQPMGSSKLQAVMQLCKELSIEVPEPTKPNSGKELIGSLWQKKKRRPQSIQINPADYTFIDGYFTNQDGTNATQISQMVPHATGVCLLTAQQAEVWIKEAQLITSDELGLLVIGQIQVPGTLTTEVITFPCYTPDKQMVLLTATLVQMGSKALKHRQGNPQQVPADACTLVAMTMYKEDWQEGDWLTITTNPMGFIRKLLENDNLYQGIHAMWGKSLRSHKSPASPHQAQTVQIHLTVEDAKLERLMAKSGFNRLFLTPKTQVGRLNLNYKIIWVSGDVPKLSSLSAKCQSCLGLVRGRQGKGYGLRFANDKHDAAWAILHPGTTPPQERGGDKVYKLQNLPFGCTTQMIDAWIAHMKWDASPIRALGPQTWLVRANAELPEAVPMFNATPILARLLPPRDTKAPEKVLLGPRPKTPAQTSADPWHQKSGHDPWANWTPQSRPDPIAPTMPQRTVQGPMENKFAEQDEKLATMQQSIDQLTKHQKQHVQQVEQQFQVAAQRNRKTWPRWTMPSRTSKNQLSLPLHDQCAATPKPWMNDSRNSSSFWRGPTSALRQRKAIKPWIDSMARAAQHHVCIAMHVICDARSNSKQLT